MQIFPQFFIWFVFHLLFSYLTIRLYSRQKAIENCKRSRNFQSIDYWKKYSILHFSITFQLTWQLSIIRGTKKLHLSENLSSSDKSNINDHGVVSIYDCLRKSDRWSYFIKSPLEMFTGAAADERQFISRKMH